MKKIGVNIGTINTVINSNIVGENFIAAPGDNDAPQAADFHRLLAEVVQSLLQIGAQRDTLQKISPATPFLVSGAEAALQALTGSFTDNGDPEQFGGIRTRLTEAGGLLQQILKNVSAAADESEEMRHAAQPVIAALPPLVEKTEILEQWAAQLWDTK